MNTSKSWKCGQGQSRPETVWDGSSLTSCSGRSSLGYMAPRDETAKASAMNMAERPYPMTLTVANHIQSLRVIEDLQVGVVLLSEKERNSLDRRLLATGA
jgi:hypothetical protein